MIIAAAMCCLGSSPAMAYAGHECDEKVPFRSARFAPADVTLMLEVRGASWLRRTIADRPIANWLSQLANSEELTHVWSALADQSGLTKGQLFDSCLGGRFAFFSRSSGDGLGEWAIVAETHPYRVKKVLERLELVMVGPASGMAISELPEHELLLARDGQSLIIGPKSRRSLFDDVVKRAGPSGDDELSSLASTEALNRAKRIGGGRVELFVRHGGLIGGYSALTAIVDGDEVSLQHLSRFDHSPFPGEVTRLEIQPSMLRSFEDHALVALAMPTDVGDGPLSTYVQARLGQPLLSPALRRNRGDVQIVTVGEVEGRMEPKPVDLLVPTFAVCMELLDPSNASADLDEHMKQLARQIEMHAQGALLKPVETIGHGPAAGARHIDLAGASDWLTGGFPVMRNVSLNWTVAPGPNQSAFAVIASDQQQLEAAVTSLLAAERDGEAIRRVAHAGSLDGVRLSHHLSIYAEQAESLVGPDVAEEFRQSMNMLAAFSAGIERARWTVTRPCGDEIRLQATITLKDGPSASSVQHQRDDTTQQECPSRSFECQKPSLF